MKSFQLVPDAFLAIERTQQGIDIRLARVDPSTAVKPNGILASQRDWPLLAPKSVLRLSGERWQGVRIGAAALLADGRLLLVSDGGYGLEGGKTNFFVLDLPPLQPQ